MAGLERALFFLLIVLALRWLMRIRTRPGQAANVLQYPRYYLYVGIGSGGLFAALALWAALYPDKGDRPPVPIYLLFLGFSFLGACVIVMYYHQWFEIDWRGITYPRTFGGRGALRWSEVTRVRCSVPMQRFRIETSDGRVIKLNATLTGLPEFAGTVLQEVPKSRMDGRTREILEGIAASA